MIPNLLDSLYYFQAMREKQEIVIAEIGLLGKSYYSVASRTEFRRRAESILITKRPDDSCIRYFPFSNTFDVLPRIKYRRNPLESSVL